MLVLRWVHMCKFEWGGSEVNLGSCSSSVVHFILRQGLPLSWSSPSELGWLVEAPKDPRVSLSSKHWDYKHESADRLFTCVLGIELESLCFRSTHIHDWVICPNFDLFFDTLADWIKKKMSQLPSHEIKTIFRALYTLFWIQWPGEAGEKSLSMSSQEQSPLPRLSARMYGMGNFHLLVGSLRAFLVLCERQKQTYCPIPSISPQQFHFYLQLDKIALYEWSQVQVDPGF